METGKDSSTSFNQENQRMPINKEQKKSDAAMETQKSEDRGPEKPKDSPGGSTKLPKDSPREGTKSPEEQSMKE